MYVIESAHSPIYTADGTINLLVKFSGFAAEMPFHATPTDTVPHGVELYNNASLGMYGPIAPYVPPPTTTVFRITRTKFLERVNAAGKFNQLKTYFNSHDYEHELWLASDGFMTDNPLILAIVAAIGANPATILAYPP